MNVKATTLHAMILLFITSLAGFADEQTLIFQNGLNGYQGTEDTFVMTGRPDQNNDGENHIDSAAFEFEWDGQDRGGKNIGLLKFNELIGEGENQIPPGVVIVKAELQTSIANAASKNQSSFIHNLLVEWEQTTATYNNVFGETGLSVGETISAASIQVFHNPNQLGETWSADVTPLVQALADGQPNLGFALIPNEGSTNGFGHVSSEAPRVESELSLTVETAAGLFRFEPGKNGYDGVKDAFISNDGSDFYKNFGGTAMIRLERSAQDDAALGLMRFDGIIGDGPDQIPPHTAVLNAALRFLVRQGENERVFVSDILPFQTEILGVPVDTFFKEDAVTFENFVEDGVYPQTGVEMADSPTAVFRAESRRIVELDVTSSLQTWVEQERPNYGWLFEASEGRQIRLNAKEGGGGFGPPKLIVTFQSPTTSVREYMLY